MSGDEEAEYLAFKNSPPKTAEDVAAMSFEEWERDVRWLMRMFREDWDAGWRPDKGDQH
jgi:hypothetical protein